MKTVQQIVEFIIQNNYPEAQAKTFDEYCFLAGLDDPTETAKGIFDKLLQEHSK